MQPRDPDPEVDPRYRCCLHERVTIARRKATWQPTGRNQRDKWMVRVDGIDKETGEHRPRQLGTYPSQRSVRTAARAVRPRTSRPGRGDLPDRLDREDVARWLDRMATAGQLSWRSIQICRTVLRAVLADAVEEGLLARSPAARVPMPREVAKPPKQKRSTPGRTSR